MRGRSTRAGRHANPRGGHGEAACEGVVCRDRARGHGAEDRGYSAESLDQNRTSVMSAIPAGEEVVFPGNYQDGPSR